MHVFWYRLKCMIRDKEMVFWTMLFPLILATFFNLAFSNLTRGEFFRAIPVALVDTPVYRENPQLQKIIKEVSEPAHNEMVSLFETRVVSLQNAKQLLLDKEVSGVVLLEIDANQRLAATVFVTQNGMNQTIIKEFFDRVIQVHETAGHIMLSRPDAAEIPQELSLFFSAPTSYFRPSTENRLFPDYTLIYFYSLIGMASFYGAFAGMKEVNAIQADLSPEAIRVNVAPSRKIKTLLSSLGAASVVQFFSLMVLLLFLKGIIGIEFGTRVPLLILLCAVACLCGVSYGTMISLLVKRSEGIKSAILIGSTMMLSFLAGMMQVQVKYAVTSAFPLMAWINPVNVITDALYALYYYPANQRYFQNLIALAGFTLLFSMISVWRLRRLKYASV